NGGLLGISDLLLRAHVMATYLSHDWGRDWGWLGQHIASNRIADSTGC
ncbi:MAG: hypothetical protein EBR45_10540, partial [Betaproteobacteria bacterium]|nr:hypothetical protein [Betaproteobacteria bacterium]